MTFDELLEQTYSTLSETSLTTGEAGGSQQAGTTSDVDKLAIAAATAEDGDEDSNDDVKKKRKSLETDHLL